MRVEADRDICAGSGACVFAAPEVFDQDSEDGRVVVLDAEPGAEHADAVRTAAASCPVAAINLEERSTVR